MKTKHMTLDILKAPFPLLTSSKAKWVSSFFFASFVYLFLITFKPFNLHLVKENQNLLILGYGGITFTVVSVAFFIFPILFPKFFSPEKWTVGKTIIYISLQLIFITIGNWAYTNSFLSSLGLVYHSLFQFFFITFSVGIFPSAFLVLFLERKLRTERENKANTINKNLIQEITPKENSHQEIYKIGTDKQFVSTFIDELLCIKSEGNYLEIYQWKEGKLIKSVIRFSLKKAKNILENEQDIHHSHRSFIVNFSHIDQISGNARNYEITLKNLPFKIPISRSFSKELLQVYTA